MSNKAKQKICKCVNIAVLSFLVVCTFFPFYFMIISSFKNNAQIAANPFLLSSPFRFENYVSAFGKIIGYMKNSLIITGCTVIGIVIVGSISAYVFAKFEFPFKNAIYMFILAFMMIPIILTLIPLFVLVNQLKLIGSYFAVILPDIATGQITYIIILRSFIEGIPHELFESARIDGAKHRQIFTHIAFPLTKATIFSLALMAFLNSWNDFLWPLLTLSANDSMKTITLGLYSFRDIQQIQYGPMFAGFVLASLPLIILFSTNMKYFISGITSGAVKA